MNQIRITLFLLTIPLVAVSAPTVHLNYTSANVVDSLDVLGVPFNPTLAVGSQQAILSTYQIVRSFNKQTGLPDNIINNDQNSFAATIAFTGDPWLVYNPFIKRWLYSYEDFDTGDLLFSISNEDPITAQTEWSNYTVSTGEINPLDPAGFLDFQQPGYDQNAYYIGVSTFDQNEIFTGSSLMVVSNSSLLAGTPNITVFPGLFPETVHIADQGFAFPATNFDPNPTYGYFLWVIYDQPETVMGNTIQLYRILDADSNTPTLGPLVSITVPPFAYNELVAAHKENLFGEVGLIQTNVGAISPYPHVRDQQLYLCLDIQMNADGDADPNGDRIGIIFYQIDLTGGTGVEDPDTVPTLVQSGKLYDDSETDPLSYYLSSIMTNKNGDMLISFNVSGNEAYINAGFTYRYASDAPGTLREPILITNSQFPYNFSPNIPLTPGPNMQCWGDQSTVVTDPVDDITFWLNQNWAGLHNAWAIQAAKVTL